MQTSKILGTISRRKSNQLKVTQRWQRQEWADKHNETVLMIAFHVFKKLKNGENHQIKCLDGKTIRGQEETLGMMNMSAFLPVVMASWAHTAKPSKRTLLHTCRLFCVNYPLIKLLRGRDTDWLPWTPLCVKGVCLSYVYSWKHAVLRHPGLSASPIRTLAAPKANGPPPGSLFSGTVLSTDSGTYKLHLSVHLLLQPFPASTSHTSQNDHATQRNRSASMSPPPTPLPTTFCGYQKWAGQKREWRRSLHLRPEAQGGPLPQAVSAAMLEEKPWVPFFFTLLLLLVIRHSI